MDPAIDHCTIVGPNDAESHGFVIEGTIAFIFDMGRALGCLGFNTLDEVWQFDVTPNDDGNVYQFTDGDIRNALIRAEYLTQCVREQFNDIPNIDHVAYLEANFTQK